MNQNKIAISILSQEGVEIPHYASTGASGADVRAHLKEAIILKPGASCLVPTGLKFAIPEGYEIQVRPRSGLALKHQVTVLNTPGTIDADYRGDLGVILINHGNQDFVIEPGMRIAQIVVMQVVQATYVPACELTETTRGCGGFGHTGFN